MVAAVIRDQVIEFRQSVAADLYTSADLIDLNSVIEAVENYRNELDSLQTALSFGHLNHSRLSALILTFPRLYGILCAMLSISSSIELADGRRLPHPILPPKDRYTAETAAELLLELGIGLVLDSPDTVYPSFRLIQIIADAPKRRFRVDARIAGRISNVVLSATETATASTGKKFASASKSMLPVAERRIVDYLITVDDKPKFAVASTFQTHSGGRQTREMRVLYPSVQARLSALGINMILIADGQGMRDMPEKVLDELFTAVPYTMSIRQAENGNLVAAFENVLNAPIPSNIDNAGIRKLIDNALETNSKVEAPSLPIPTDASRLALASYASTNNHLDLRLADNGVALEWGKANLVKTFRNLRFSFEKSLAAESFAQLLRAEYQLEKDDTLHYATAYATLQDDQVFSAKFAICSYLGRADANILREIARHALQYAPESRVAVLVTSEPITLPMLQELRDVQTFLPVTIVVVDINTCIEMAQSREQPRDRLRTLMLEQTDLTKLSPFVVRGVTPARVFFGREQEEATLLSTLSTNSVALLGGRRIGKTSLMRHSFARLTTANLRPYFGDCQVVRTWGDFGLMARRNWKVSLPDAFKPHHLFDLVQQLSSGSDRPVVILLDEIDQLLDWDKSHTEDEVPEAFFRACRSISQQGLAQFVFSGERTIANRLWDTTSPHWNFCRPLMLQQLAIKPSTALISEPLEALGVRIDRREEFLSACWESTDGHPELLQFLGDKIVENINLRDRNDIFAEPEDIALITEQFEFAEQYLETYWGQASPLERVISILLLEQERSIDQLAAMLETIAKRVEMNKIVGALRMLELYGIAEQSNIGYQLRARWFTTALSSYGGPELSIRRYIGEIQA